MDRENPTRGSFGGNRNSQNRGFRSGFQGNNRGGFGGRSFGGGRSRFGDRGRRPRHGVEKIDHNRFISKAEDLEIQEDTFVPAFVYSELEVDSVLKSNIARKGYDKPTPVQSEAIPAVMRGEDVLGIANTGTGKTAAFLVPLLDKVVKNRKEKVLIIVPTRELAEQINNELFSLTKDLRIFSVNCIGGDNIRMQISALRRGCNFVIGTPGRLQDLSDRGVIDYSQFRNIVLDEVDRMLDMGFVDEIQSIIANLPAEKQSLFFSATVNRKVEDLIGTILKPNYTKVNVAKNVTTKNIDQNVVYFNDPNHKIEQLKTVINDHQDQKIIIFANTKRDVDTLDKMLYDLGHKLDSLHGDKRQNYRKKAIEKFKTNRINILIATDVAARGLDIRDVALVVNFDVPNTHDDYVHRIGRTGRAGKSGKALTFVRAKSQPSTNESAEGQNTYSPSYRRYSRY